MNKIIKISVVVCFVGGVLSSEIRAEMSAAETKVAAMSAADVAAVQEAAAQRKFAGLDFGVGVSMTLDSGGDDRVESAEIVDGVVRVSKNNNVTAGVMLESHYFFTPDWIGNANGNKIHGIGPFVAVRPGSGEIIDAFSLGVMVGFRRESSTAGSWNLGLGWVVDPSVQVLGDGFRENEPPPGSESQVRFKNIDQNGVNFLVSFSF